MTGLKKRVKSKLTQLQIKEREIKIKHRNRIIHERERTHNYQLASENPSNKVEIGILKTNNKTIQQPSTIFLQSNNNILPHPIGIMNSERPSTATTPTTKEIPKSINRKNVNQPSKKNCNSNIDRKVLTFKCSPALKKSSTNVYLRRILPNNNQSINGSNPNGGKTQKIINFGHNKTLEPTDDPT